MFNAPDSAAESTGVTTWSVVDRMVAAFRDELLACGRTAAREFTAERGLVRTMLWRAEREHPAGHVAAAAVSYP